MQTPLFWLDLSEYKGAQLKALSVDGKLKGMLVDMSAGVDEDMAHILRMHRFEPADSHTPHKLYSPDTSGDIRERLRTRLTKARETAFSAAEHLAIVDTVRSDETDQPGVGNEAAKQRAAARTEAAGPGITVPPSRPQKEQIVDVGEVRGFAIKDLRGYGDAMLRAVGRMTEEQQKAHLTKNAIWPALSYNEMAENGVEPGAAFLIKAMRDSLCPAPGKISARRRLTRPPNGEVYAHCVATIRDCMADVKTLDEAVEAVYRVAETFGHQRETQWSGQMSMGTTYRTPLTHDSSGEPIQGRALDGIKGYRAFWACALDSNDPEHTEGIKERYRSHAYWNSGGNDKWDFLPRNHALRTGRRNTMSEEEKQHRAEAEKDKAPTRVTRVLHAEAVREGGKQWRTGDVQGIDLIERFDLSGVEFGNWESQAERQELMNQAYDAFSDMADALGIPPAAVGFGGRLGMCFGSRGKGGKNAASAHFEPTNFAINLTKKGGAGALAHEWGHAFDRAATKRGVTGRRAGMATDDLGGVPGSVQGPAVRSTTLSDATAENVNHMMRAIMYDREAIERDAIKQVKESLWHKMVIEQHGRTGVGGPIENLGSLDDTMRAQIEGCIGVAANTLRNWCYMDEQEADELAREFADRALIFAENPESPLATAFAESEKYHKIWNDETRAMFDDALRQHIKRVDNIVRLATGIACLDGGDKTLEWRGIDEDWWAKIGKAAVERAKYFEQFGFQAPSAMLKQARAMDSDRSRKYWSLKEEMFARSFEVYVKSKLGEQGTRNDFLVSYRKPATVNGAVFSSVYPAGADLAEIATAADTLFGNISIEHTVSASPVREGKQGVVMYSLDGDQITTGVPAPITAELLLNEIRHMIGHVVDVDMAETLGDMGGQAVAGAYHYEQQLVRIAMDCADPRAAAHHEAYHAASDHLMDETEEAIVAAAFMPGGRYRKDLERALFRDNKAHLITEIQRSPHEAQAYGFQYWMANKLEVGSDTPVGKVFKRVKDFFEAARNAIRGYTYMIADDVFKDLESGYLRGRAEAQIKGRRPAHEGVAALRREDMPGDAEQKQRPAAAAGLGL